MMANGVRLAQYFYVNVEDTPGKAYEVLAELASRHVNLLAFSAVPFGPDRVELTIFPDKPENLTETAKNLGWKLIGPQHAFLISGDDRLGILAGIHKKLRDAKIDVYASTGVTDGKGHFGYVIYVKEADHEKAAKALGV